MGKPFAKELENILDTYNWAIQQNIDELRQDILQNKNIPLYIVGSGGSLSACHFAAQLYQQHGIMAKAITPLELVYSKTALRCSNVLFISASGKNTDILFSYKVAMQCEPNRIYSICMASNSPLSKLGKGSTICKSYSYDAPFGKDGFLATNSLIAFFAIIFKALSIKFEIDSTINIDLDYQIELTSFIEKITPNFTFNVLYAGAGQPVAIDLESKLAEAALADVLISDYRNFGHGRHHWFDKRKNSSAIIALITPSERDLAKKTLSFLPKDIPVLIIYSERQSFLSSIQLLIKAFYFINELGKKQGIDPGKPGVPDFGSKLYHLNYQKFYQKTKDDLTENEKLAIIRKSGASSFELMSTKEKIFWVNAYREFIKKLSTVNFGSLILDYDGTLCSSSNRFKGIDNLTSEYLKKLLSEGITIGIATGRGKSVRVDLQKSIPQQYWRQVVIGYYNCSDIGLLSDNSCPNKEHKANSDIEYVFNQIKNQVFVTDIIPELKPYQVTIEILDNADWHKVRLSIIQFVLKLNRPNIQILESSHSIDIIALGHCNKLNIVKQCLDIAQNNKKSSNYLCIGDKGKWPGNDYQLLSSKYSLSSDEVSSLPESCWNLAGASVRNIEATLFYLSCLKSNENGVKFYIQ